MVLVFLILFQCHQESTQFNIVSALLNIIFKHNFKKLLNSLKTETIFYKIDDELKDFDNPKIEDGRDSLNNQFDELVQIIL